MRFVFRADASVQIGTGHIMRCLALADELTWQGHECRFICREHKGHLGALIVSKGYELTILKVDDSAKLDSSERGSTAYADWLGVSWQHDAKQSFKTLVSLKADWLIVDHYALDARWEKHVAGAVDRIMVIDDLADRRHKCSLLLDQNLGRISSDYDGLVPTDCKRLIGPRYALLRPEFARLRRVSLARRSNPRLKQLLISMGGVDKDNATGQVLEALALCDMPRDCCISVVMGGNAPWLTQIEVQAAAMPWPTEVVVNVSDMAKRMTQADMAIGAAGSTSWERCCMGLPTLMVVLADNQREAGQALQLAGGAILIGGSDEIHFALPDALRTFLELQSLRTMSQAAANITDGQGLTRIQDILMDGSA